MKKTYITPALSALTIEQSLPIAASLIVDNETHNDIQGDVKSSSEWEDIWE